MDPRAGGKQPLGWSQQTFTPDSLLLTFVQSGLYCDGVLLPSHFILSRSTCDPAISPAPQLMDDTSRWTLPSVCIGLRQPRRSHINTNINFPLNCLLAPCRLPVAWRAAAFVYILRREMDEMCQSACVCVSVTLTSGSFIYIVYFITASCNRGTQS